MTDESEQQSLSLGDSVILEEEPPFLPGVPIRAANKQTLVQYLITIFNSNGDISPHATNFPHIFFLMHRWFFPSTSLAYKLIEEYHHSDELYTTCVSSCQHKPIPQKTYNLEFNIPFLHDSSSTDDSTVEYVSSPNDNIDIKTDTTQFEFDEAVSSSKFTQQLDIKTFDNNEDICPVSDKQATILHVLRFWILNFPLHFQTEDGLMSILKEFQNKLPQTYSKLIDHTQIPSYEWLRNISVRQNGKLHRQRTCKVSLHLMNLEPTQLAALITYLEHKVIRRITFHEFKKYCTSGSLKETPKLDRSVSLFNGLTQWIQCLVLSRTTPQQRGDVITKFIQVAQKLLELHNYNSLMSVVGSISHSVLCRLTKTMNCLSLETKRSLAELTDLLSSSNNFSNYRRSLSEATGFKIPILGIHLKDLISLNTALPNIIEPDKINVRKMVQLSGLFQDLENLQMSSAPVDVNMDHVKTLTLSLDMQYSEDEIYELSLAREPRNSTSPQTSPTQTVLFAEWAANTCSPPEPQTIEKHVNAMVEAVFKNYDSDRDGYISHEEFESVAGNFPFIASFCVLDADHDGMISKPEMTHYFIQANCHLLKSGFKHDFHETTYFKPTFCAHCTGLLWGLIRQGYKCRDCGINAHKHCKDLVVMECRIRFSDNHHSLSARRRFKRKKKTSLSEESSPTLSSRSDKESIGDTSDGGTSLPPSPRPITPWGPKRKISDSLLVPSKNRNSSKLRPQHSCPESTRLRGSRHPLLHAATLQTTVVPTNPAIIVTNTKIKNNNLTEIPSCSTNNETKYKEKQIVENVVPINTQKSKDTPNLLSNDTKFLNFPPKDLFSNDTLTLSNDPTTLPTNAFNFNYEELTESDIDNLMCRLKELEEEKRNLEKENAFLLVQLQAAYEELNSLREHMGEVRQQTVAFILSQMETLHLQKNTHV